MTSIGANDYLPTEHTPISGGNHRRPSSKGSYPPQQIPSAGGAQNYFMDMSSVIVIDGKRNSLPTNHHNHRIHTETPNRYTRRTISNTRQNRPTSGISSITNLSVSRQQGIAGGGTPRSIMNGTLSVIQSHQQNSLYMSTIQQPLPNGPKAKFEARAINGVVKFTGIPIEAYAVEIPETLDYFYERKVSSPD